VNIKFIQIYLLVTELTLALEHILRTFLFAFFFELSLAKKGAWLNSVDQDW
jgi:hypothetical protein